MSNMMTEEESYQNLAAAVIQQAVFDTREAPKTIKKSINQKNQILTEINRKDISKEDLKKAETKLCNAESLKRQAIKLGNYVESFIKTPWFETLSEFVGVNPDYIRERLAKLA
jgi:benzoyl-CoA reductase/2-hydroxyglutaryl-CoA dehydratase subunit BcrC/BadD/HgdB